MSARSNARDHAAAITVPIPVATPEPEPVLPKAA